MNRGLEPRRSWHPFHDLAETEIGHWEMFAAVTPGDTRPPEKIGDIRIVRHKGQLGYRCLVLGPGMDAPVDLGLAPTLRDAAKITHSAYSEATQAAVIPRHPGYPPY